jgi:DNA-binding NtrC family response regulator
MTKQSEQPGNFPSGTREGEIMQGLLIVDEDMDCRKQMADMFIEAGYNVIVTNSVANALYGILKKTAQVVLLGTKFDELTAADLIPLLKQCNRKLTIILVAADTSLPLIRKLRAEGIFYHALKPVDAEDREEIRQAVHCAFENLRINPA